MMVTDLAAVNGRIAELSAELDRLASAVGHALAEDALAPGESLAVEDGHALVVTMRERRLRCERAEARIAELEKKLALCELEIP